jgi:hypothetical protein
VKNRPLRARRAKMRSALAWNILRGTRQTDGAPIHHIGRRIDDTYVLFDGQTPRWSVTIDWGDYASFPFREEMVWSAAGVAVIGGGAAVYLLDLETAHIRLRVPMHSYFGHLALDVDRGGDEVLFLLGCDEVIAYGKTLDRRWHTKDVAVDGVLFDRVEGGRLWVRAEMDPPGGWFAVELDLATGKELSRRPDFPLGG